MLYEPVAAFILEACRRHGLTASIVSGVSSIDVALALLAQPLLPGMGLQVGDGSFFIDHPPAAASAVLIYKAAMTRGLLPKLAASLLRNRPKSAPVAIVERGNFGPKPSDAVRWTTLAGLAKALDRHPSIYASLFLPPAP
jgi:siroheme synthase